jgi:chorismate synthase
MKIETDEPIIRSGIRHGLTLGSPISILIDNRDFANGNGPDGTPWQQAMSIEPSENPGAPITHLRPGHADTPGVVKYQQDDARNILERSSARESAARVAAGSIAKRFLEEFGIEVRGHVQAIGGIHAPAAAEIDWNAVEISIVRCSDSESSNRMVEVIDNARDTGDSLGGIVEVVATGLPIGLGSHIQWDRKLTTRLAGAVMSLNAAKGVEFGAGFAQADLPGSSVHDVIKPVSEWVNANETPWEQPFQRQTNNSGGLEGGMTTGEPLIVRAAIKPIATIINGLPTVDLRDGKFVDRAHFERSDITFVPTCSIIAEAMVAIVLADAMLEKFGGDHISETSRNLQTYRRGYADTRTQ